jgi:hypothetical protein
MALTPGTLGQRSWLEYFSGGSLETVNLSGILAPVKVLTTQTAPHTHSFLSPENQSIHFKNIPPNYL